MKCEGCGYVFAHSREVFGGVGQAWCFDCYMEDRELARERWPLENERSHCLEYIECCEMEIAEYEKSGGGPLPGDLRGTQYVLRAEVAADAARERLGDIETELACLTVQYQRRYGVIGRAA